MVAENDVIFFFVHWNETKDLFSGIQLAIQLILVEVPINVG